jgi:hypothetical protein
MDQYGVPVLKKLFIIFLLLTTLLFGAHNTIESKIYALILHTIFPTKSTIKVFTNDTSKQEILLQLRDVKVVLDPKRADFLLLKKELPQTPQGIIFATTYHLLKEYKKEAIGGFYWQKGRPNILFLRDNLQKYHIHLPKNMQEYIEDRL